MLEFSKSAKKTGQEQDNFVKKQEKKLKTLKNPQIKKNQEAWLGGSVHPPPRANIASLSCTCVGVYACMYVSMYVCRWRPSKTLLAIHQCIKIKY